MKLPEIQRTMMEMSREMMKVILANYLEIVNVGKNLTASFKYAIFVTSIITFNQGRDN